MLKHSWIAALVVAVIMLPASVGTMCLWCGMDEYMLLWLPGFPILMLPVVFMRIFFIPQALCLLSVVFAVLQVISAFVDKRVRWRLPVTVLLAALACTGLVSLEVFFPAMMGI